MLEALDGRNRPVAVLPETIIHEQRLRHHRVAALVYGPDGRLLLSRRPSGSMDGALCWDISFSAHVAAGTSRYETIRHGLYQVLGITVSKLRFIRSRQAGAETEHETLSIYTLTVRSDLSPLDASTVPECMLLTAHEVGCLVDAFPGQITSTLRVLFRSGLIFLQSPDS